MLCVEKTALEGSSKENVSVVGAGTYSPCRVSPLRIISRMRSSLARITRRLFSRVTAILYVSEYSLGVGARCFALLVTRILPLEMVQPIFLGGDMDSVKKGSAIRLELLSVIPSGGR